MSTASAPITSFIETARSKMLPPKELICRWINYFIHRRIAVRNKAGFVKCARLWIGRRHRSTELSPKPACHNARRLFLAAWDRSGIVNIRSVAFGSAECDDPQGQVSLGV